ncbi:MAG: protein kinase [Myxococcales bacterium]|nr:protein kinase [Myxococcales bacterium]
MNAAGAVGAVEAGVVLAGRFRVEGELGEGGMARVFRVTDLATQRPFALKLLRADIADNAEAVARLKREAEVLAALDNPAVVGIETYGELPDRRLFIVMEMLEGETLGARMRREQRLAPEALTPIVTGVAAGLSAAHRAGVVHRDLKPDNVFLATGADGDLQVKILDFGISKVYSNEERLTQTGQVLGTPRYMAPEQLGAEPDLDARTDVYALGVMLYEALAGTPPFVATTPSDLILAILHGKTTSLRTLRPDLSAELEALVARAMARSRDARFRTVVELAEAWIHVVGARAAASGARAGMRTKLVGSGGPGVSVSASGGGPSGFRIATFSELEEQAADRGAAETSLSRPRPLPATRAMDAADEPGAFVPAPLALASSDAPVAHAPAAHAAASPVAALAPAYAASPSAPYAPPSAAAYAASPNAGYAPAYAASASASYAPAYAASASASYAPASYGAAPSSAGGPTPTTAPYDDEDWGDAPLVVPTSRGRWIWVVVALLAGAVTGGLALAYLDRSDGAQRGEVMELEAQPAAAPAGHATASAQDEGATSVEPSSAPADPQREDMATPDQAIAASAATPAATTADAPAATAGAPPSGAMPPGETPPRGSARSTRGEPRIGVTAPPITPASTPVSPFEPTPMVETLPPAFAPQPREAPPREPQPALPPDPFVTTTTSDPIAEARAALHANDPARCLQLLAGSPRMTAARLRLEGDCYRASGNAQEAAKSYERICALYPSYTGIAEVRALAERYGGRCE